MYSKFNVLLLLSKNEGFPNILNEAIQFGCKIILSNENAWLENIAHVKQSIIFIGSTNEIIDFINKKYQSKRKSIVIKPKEFEKINQDIIESIYLYFNEDLDV